MINKSLYRIVQELFYKGFLNIFKFSLVGFNVVSTPFVSYE